MPALLVAIVLFGSLACKPTIAESEVSTESDNSRVVIDAYGVKTSCDGMRILRNNVPRYYCYGGCYRKANDIVCASGGGYELLSGSIAPSPAASL